MSALSQGQFNHPNAAHAAKSRLGHPSPGRRLRSNLPRGDFLHDKLSTGRSYKMLTVLDEFWRQALAVKVRTKMGPEDVLEVLYPLLLRHGTPEYIRADNGPEFTAYTTQDWLQRVGVTPIRIYPGSPWENGYNEQLNGTLRSKVLNVEWFTTTEQAQIFINHWLKQYNPTWPHQALKMRPPVPETILEKQRISDQKQMG